ncbi:LytR/AlgR family response regulator transcription factor [Thermophilibacter provencensis]|uniref:LytTR family DNA-binding domain-containing protein n=1 Tax=Thermophilibacter provencensis TaxID=1852386 RepID=A0A921GF85_9ACTN|nr:LytTR family DNA-binding domain-containing protein [Thermophilibacter provencensis]HJF45201.1 LytTR family DNA-binding domain-containing protein [Thermophilibacter provencensis]
MKTIAIVDDSPDDIARLAALVDRYFGGDKGAYGVVTFTDGLFLLDGYRPIYDVIFLDIEMRLVDGIGCAAQLRIIDDEVPVVYTTRMAQYATDGYEVGAMGYLLKPVNYYALRLALDRALGKARRQAPVRPWLTEGDEHVAVDAREVDYVEVSGHDLSYHCGGRIYHEWGSLKQCSDRLASLGFSFCSRYCLVNLSHVERLRADSVVVGGDEIPVSRRSRKRLSQELMDFYQRGSGVHGDIG